MEKKQNKEKWVLVITSVLIVALTTYKEIFYGKGKEKN